MSDEKTAPAVNVIDIASRKPVSADTPSLATLFAEDLARSGITPTDARRAGIEPVGPDEAWRILRPKHPERAKDFTVGGLAIPYSSPFGEPLHFSRVRRLAGKWNKDDDGSQRYAQPPNSMPHLYLPASAWREWLPKKRGEKIRIPRLIVTEGEKKALKASLVGLPAVAIGGVTAYRSAKFFITLLDEFRWFDLSATDVEVVYDSDAWSNPSVAEALRAISWTLRRDANTKSIADRRLTHENTGGKTGLDDLLAAHRRPDGARRAYEATEKREDPMSEAFAVFNRDIVHVRRKTRYYNVATATWYESQKKIVEEYAVGTPVVSPSGKELYPIARWFTDRPAPTTVLDVVYEPGEPERFRPEDAAGDVLNTWRPTRLEPIPYRRRAEIQPFLEFVDYLTPGLTEDERRWLLDWSAFPLQKPGRKVMSAVLIWSKATGTGKNTYGRILRECYGGHNTYELKGSALKSQYNEWALNQLVVISEVHLPSYGERAAVMADLKTLLTEDRIDLDRKYLPRENVPNHVNVYMNSNRPNALILDKDDRRFFVAEGPGEGEKWPAQRFSAFNEWLESGGFERVYGYLLARDLKDFDPFAAPPRTRAWHDMNEATSADPVDEIIDALVSSPRSVLGTAAGMELWRPEQLVMKVNEYAREIGLRATVTPGVLRAAIRGRVEKRAFEDNRGGKRRIVTAYALVNVEHWARASNEEWRKYLRKRDPDL